MPNFLILNLNYEDFRRKISQQLQVQYCVTREKVVSVEAGLGQQKCAGRYCLLQVGSLLHDTNSCI